MRSDELDIMSNFETKEAILDAMAAMVESIPFSKIKVTDLCKAAGVSRATFYRTFDDKFDAINWSVRLAHWQGTSQIGRTMSWYDGYYITETAIMRRMELYTSAAKSNDYNALDNFSQRYRRETLVETITDRYGKAPDAHLLFDIDTVATLECAMFPRWHNGLIDTDLPTLCRWMTQNVPAQLFSMLNTPMRPKGGF